MSFIYLNVLCYIFSLFVTAQTSEHSIASFYDLETSIMKACRSGQPEKIDQGQSWDYMVGLCNRDQLGGAAFTRKELSELIRTTTDITDEFLNHKKCWPVVRSHLIWLACKAMPAYSDRGELLPSQIKKNPHKSRWDGRSRPLAVEEMEGYFAKVNKYLLMPFAVKETSNIRNYLSYLVESSSSDVIESVLRPSQLNIQGALNEEEHHCWRIYVYMRSYYRDDQNTLPLSQLVVIKQRELDARPKPAPKESWVPRWIGGCFGLMSADGEGYAAHHTSGYTRASNNIPADQRPLLTSGADKKRD